ncbi:MAG: hypothetical protein HY912_02410, partial [Desulfomonile tiedjei]|nr:hypothetical protein [Desulfomonile tiedjei]
MSETELLIKVPIKSGIVGLAEYGERALHHSGVPKKFAVPLKFSWELLHQGGVEAVAALLRQQHSGLTALEEAAIITALEALVAAVAGGAVITAATPVWVVVGLGVGVVVGVGYSEEYILEAAGYFKKEAMKGFPVQEPCEGMYWLGQAEVARDLFHDGQGGILFPRRDPLVLDLDGDGIEMTSTRSGTFFDLGNDGFAEQTGWVDPDDGLLAMDRNGDGIINNGTELFGDQTYLSTGARATNGFAALEDLDSNADGRIDANDAAFSQLRVWQDEDGDGYSLPSELHALDELGIRSINLDSTITNVTDANGNTENRVCSFERTDGTTSQIAEYSLDREPMYTIPEEWLDVPEDIAALPNLQGYGNVYDLHQAMVRDTTGELKSLVEQFANATDESLRKQLMAQILYEWAGTEDVKWSPG